MRVSQWRTVGVVVFLALVLLLALVVVRAEPKGPELLAELSWPLVFFAATVAGKSAVQHLAGGAGVKGAVRALLTDTKPEEEPKP